VGAGDASVALEELDDIGVVWGGGLCEWGGSSERLQKMRSAGLVKALPMSQQRQAKSGKAPAALSRSSTGK